MGQGGDADLDRQPGQAEHADGLAQQQADGDAHRYVVGEAFDGDAAQRQASVGEGEQRQDAVGDPGVQRVFEGQQRRRLGVFRAQGNAESQGHAGQCRVDTALEHADPEDQADDHVRPELDHAEPVHRHQRGNARSRQAKGQGREFAGIEDCDDDDGAEVIDDRQGHQEQFQRHRHAFAEQGQYAESEGDVGGGRNGPATQGRGVVAIEEPVDQRRHQHAADRRCAGQDDLRRLGQLAVEHFAFHFQADQQEEHRHQAVVDPQQQRFGDFQRADLRHHRSVEQAGVQPRQR